MLYIKDLFLDIAWRCLSQQHCLRGDLRELPMIFSDATCVDTYGVER